MRSKPHSGRILATACLSLLLAACSLREKVFTPPGGSGDVYTPSAAQASPGPVNTPTPGGTPAIARESTREAPRLTPTPQCADNLTFVEDLTIPDGTVVAPQDPLDKQWRVENSGTCNWDARYRLKLVAGPDLGAPTEQALYPARSGTQTVIGMTFTAPKEPGTYRSAWQAFNPQGQAFGEPFFIEVMVQNP